MKVAKWTYIDDQAKQTSRSARTFCLISKRFSLKMNHLQQFSNAKFGDFVSRQIQVDQCEVTAHPHTSVVSFQLVE